MRAFSVVALLTALPFVLMFELAVGLDDGLALTPPMAWTSWDLCRFEVNATLIKEVALALNSTGLQATSRQGRWWHLAGISCPHSDF